MRSTASVDTSPTGASRARREPDLSALYSLSVSALWKQVRGEHVCFFSICAYLFFEYVRPQTIYPAIAFFPWTAFFALVALVATLFDKARKTHPNAITKLLIVYGIVVLLSSTFAYLPRVSFSYLGEYFNWVLIYFAIIRSVTTQRRYFVFLLLYMLCNFKMTQHGFLSWAGRGFTFDIDGVGGAPGWFENSGEFGIQLCIFTPLIVAFIIAIRKYCSAILVAALCIVPFTAIASTVASSSRGAMVGLCASALWSIKTTKYFFRALIVGCIIGTAVYWSIPPQSLHRFQNSGNDRTSIHRIDRWHKGWETMKKYPVLGVGHENWLPYYLDKLNYGVPGTPLVHNMFVQAGTENGFLGLGTLVAIVFSFFSVNRKTRSVAAARGDNVAITISHGLDAATLGLIISGSFVTVLYYPYIWIQAGFIASLSNTVQNIEVES